MVHGKDTDSIREHPAILCLHLRTEVWSGCHAEAPEDAPICVLTEADNHLRAHEFDLPPEKRRAVVESRRPEIPPAAAEAGPPHGWVGAGSESEALIYVSIDI
jgi:hypothetical protein